MVDLAAQLLPVFISGQVLRSSPITIIRPQKMTTMLKTMDWDSSIPDYIEEDVGSITAEERENRARLDELVDKVHESHS